MLAPSAAETESRLHGLACGPESVDARLRAGLHRRAADDFRRLVEMAPLWREAAAGGKAHELRELCSRLCKSAQPLPASLRVVGCCCCPRCLGSSPHVGTLACLAAPSSLPSCAGRAAASSTALRSSLSRPSSSEARARSLAAAASAAARACERVLGVKTARCQAMLRPLLGRGTHRPLRLCLPQPLLLEGSETRLRERTRPLRLGPPQRRSSISAARARSRAKAASAVARAARSSSSCVDSSARLSRAACACCSAARAASSAALAAASADTSRRASASCCAYGSPRADRMSRPCRQRLRLLLRLAGNHGRVVDVPSEPPS